MRKTGQLLGQLIDTLRARPDELMLELGGGGELTVARIRALLSMLLLLLPLINALQGGLMAETLVGLVGAVVANVMAQLWLALAQRPRRFAWLPYATGSYDVTATTGVLVLLAMRDPAAGLNSMVVWSFYLFSIAMTALRNDGRLTFYIGALSLCQYGLLALLIYGRVSDPSGLVSIDYGTASASSVIQRLVLLAMMTVLTASIVFRMQKLVELSGKDALTGLPNRAWLLQRMPHVFEAVRRNGASLSLGLIDIDGFKPLYEAYGHVESERAIRQIGLCLQQVLHQDEHLVRLNGHEFVIVLRDPIGNAWERVDRCRRALADRDWIAERGGDRYRLSVSGGLAAWPQDGLEMSALLGTADRRLRSARQEGGNRLLVRDA